MTGFGNLEIATRGRASASDTEARGSHAEEAPCLVFRKHSRDVIIDHDHFVCMSVPLLGKDADGG